MITKEPLKLNSLLMELIGLKISSTLLLVSLVKNSKVDDVQYCIEQANDYVNGVGDFAGYPQPNTRVEVYEVCENNN